LTTFELALLLCAVIFGATAVGMLAGRYLRQRSEHLRDPFSAVNTALLGLVGLVLAFGLALAVGRYESRRAAVVDEANAIGTTYLRAQTLAEPARSRSLDLLRRYTDVTIRLSNAVPGSDDANRAIADGAVLQRQLWALAGQSLTRSPTASAPRLYVETLNDTIDLQEVKVAGLNNRVPAAVLTVEIVGAAVALALLALYVALVGKGTIAVLTAAALVTLLLLVTFDLDRPERGMIQVPDTPLTSLRASFERPPAYAGPPPTSEPAGAATSHAAFRSALQHCSGAGSLWLRSSSSGRSTPEDSWLAFVGLPSLTLPWLADGLEPRPASRW
jgi:hypothetical protein